MKVLFCVGVVKREVNCDFVLFGFAGIATFETNLTVPSENDITSFNIILVPVYVSCFNKQVQIYIAMCSIFRTQFYYI